MKNIVSFFSYIWNKYKKYSILMFFLILMIVIHRYIFIYADDIYYCRDSALGLKYLPEFMMKELNVNGRVWVHVLLMILLKNNIYIYRIINPIVIVLSVVVIARICTNSKDSNKFIVATMVGTMFFIILPIQIANTTIYYAACSLNYLYPTVVSMLYGYLLYKEYQNCTDNYKIKWWLIFIAFIAGSSTQQAGMIAIGFTVMIYIYFKIIKNINTKIKFTIYHIFVFIGYMFVSYGSIKRIFLEKSAGKGMDISNAINSIIKTNIFNIPISRYVLVICICSIFWIYYYYKNNSINKFNKWNICISSIAVIGYLYCVLYKKYEVSIFSIESTTKLILSISFIAFTLIYLINIIYVSTLILVKDKEPFIIFSVINAIGAQLMLIVVDSRFASSYKIIFPSILLLMIYVTYTFVKFYKNKIFILLNLIVLSLATGNFYIILISFCFIIVYGIFKQLLSVFINKFIVVSSIIMFFVVGISVFSLNYDGYKLASYNQVFNMNAIYEYQHKKDKSILLLKRVPSTIYGYNVGNWNDIPSFMKQCYRIDKNTLIKYIN
ncbi:DUF6056 family protein [Clostridium oceanicum]|uniref:Glycosyltransferase RgtA/B/C/D-like domain-containing protein n=1 Tax=Clostridium oceanicum TaxID=1543 RepID=A0ABN1JW06_9CLOT